MGQDLHIHVHNRDFFDSHTLKPLRRILRYLQLGRNRILKLYWILLTSDEALRCRLGQRKQWNWLQMIQKDPPFWHKKERTLAVQFRRTTERFNPSISNYQAFSQTIFISYTVFPNFPLFLWALDLLTVCNECNSSEDSPEVPSTWHSYDVQTPGGFWLWWKSVKTCSSGIMLYIA